MKPADAPLNNRASLFKQTEPPLTAHYFAQLVRLGGLAPGIVTAILEGRQPANLTRTRLARTKALPLD